MSKPQTRFRRRLLRAGIATATTVASIAAVAAPAYAASVALTLSSTSASGAAVASPGVNVVASSSTAWLTSATTTSAKVLFNTAATCGNNYPASVTGTMTDAGNLTKYSATTGMFAVPTGLQPTATTTYRVCVYTGATTSDTLIGNSAFTIFADPGVGSAVIDVATGATSGGTKVTVTGASGLPTTAAGYDSVTVGGTAVTTLTPISASSFSFITPPHAKALTAPIVVNLTAGGTATLTPTFAFYNAITVTPNSGLVGADVPVYITGGGFNSLTLNSGAFGAINTAYAHIYLTKGAYSPADNTPPTFATATTPVTNCASPVKLSDTEIICTLVLTSSIVSASPYTGGGAVAAGAYTVSLINNATVANATTTGASVVTPSSTFTVANNL